MTREPVFFVNTQFLINGFHANGHTKCSTAAFLKSYSKVDPQLGQVNSSAAECGNSVMACIQKSVSYMSQSRAILYMKVFLSCSNWMKRRKMAAEGNSYSNHKPV